MPLVSRPSLVHTTCSAAPDDRFPSRREAMAVVTGSMLLTVLPQKSEAKGGKMGGTNADPKDKAKLEEAAAVIQVQKFGNPFPTSWVVQLIGGHWRVANQGLEEKLKDESKWGEIAEIVSKVSSRTSMEPFTKDSMDKMFSLAAKSLPSNIQKIYGGDGGQWVGLKNEARATRLCCAMDGAKAVLAASRLWMRWMLSQLRSPTLRER
eukprot:3539460-Rhodomonas_salina.3